jgi:hypothetical protein
MEVYEETRIPRALRCLHTFCDGCLNGLAQKHEMKKLECPTCRQETVFSGRDVTTLLCNFSLLDAACAFTASKKGLKCDLCEEEAALFRCVECEEFMCAACSRPHRKSKASRDHHLLPVEEFKAQGAVRNLQPGGYSDNVPAAVVGAAAASETVLEPLVVEAPLVDIATPPPQVVWSVLDTVFSETAGTVVNIFALLMLVGLGCSMLVPAAVEAPPWLVVATLAAAALPAAALAAAALTAYPQVATVDTVVNIFALLMVAGLGCSMLVPVESTNYDDDAFFVGETLFEPRYSVFERMFALLMTY